MSHVVLIVLALLELILTTGIFMKMFATPIPPVLPPMPPEPKARPTYDPIVLLLIGKDGLLRKEITIHASAAPPEIVRDGIRYVWNHVNAAGAAVYCEVSQ